MNSLSWLLYLGDVLPTVGGVLSGAGFGAGLLAMFLLLPISIEGLESYMKPVVAFTVVGFTVGMVGLFVPSRQTILMIAASEMGEAVVKTPEAQEVFGDLKVILKKQLEALKK